VIHLREVTREAFRDLLRERTVRPKSLKENENVENLFGLHFDSPPVAPTAMSFNSSSDRPPAFGFGPDPDEGVPPPLEPVTDFPSTSGSRIVQTFSAFEVDAAAVFSIAE
jgi:hypothetical protein